MQIVFIKSFNMKLWEIRFLSHFLCSDQNTEIMEEFMEAYFFFFGLCMQK